MEEASPPFDVALLGFGNFERSAMVSYLRLSGSRTAAYRQTESLAGADFVVADADHAGTLDAVLGADRVADTVFIGSIAPDGALAWMMRPIDPLQVFRELDAAVSLRRARAVEPTPLHPPLPVVARASERPAAKPAASAEQPPARRADDEGQPLSALLVDGNEASLRAFGGQLSGLGFRTTTANSSQRALELLGQAAFDAVFFELELDAHSELDGLSLCQLIRRSRANGHAAPVLVVVSQQSTPTDRVRAAFAGCDVHLAKPLDDATLRRALRRLGLRAAGNDSGFNSGPGGLNSSPMPISGADATRRAR